MTPIQSPETQMPAKPFPQMLLLLAVFGLAMFGLSGGLLSRPGLAQTCPEGATAPSEDQVISLGHSPERPYVAAVPGQQENALDQIKQCYSGAFITTSRLGPYIHVGSFESYREAQAVTNWLRSQNLDARVIYRP